METTPAPARAAHEANAPHMTPCDFFLWLGFVVTFYGSVVSLVTLIFEYINIGFPDTLMTYTDPYSAGVRFAMATLIVFVPVCLIIGRKLRIDAEKDSSKERIWVRHWAILLTIFLAGAALVIDTITLVNTFLNGEISIRFILKVLTVFLIAGGTFAHFIAENVGYWIHNPRKAVMVGTAVFILCLATLVSGFLIVGTPGQVRMLREDSAKISDLQNIQYQIIDYWRLKQKLPVTLVDLNNDLESYMVPMDAQTKTPYEYRAVSATSFELCAVFNASSPETGDGTTPPAYTGDSSFTVATFSHGPGRTCFTRTIDPVKYPPARAEKPL